MNYIGRLSGLEFRTNKKYAIVNCKKNGIDIICTDDISKVKTSEFVFKFGYCTKVIYLPVRIINAYNLEKEFSVIEVSEDHFLIDKERVCKVLPLNTQAEYPDIDWDNAPVLRKKNLSLGKFSVRKEESPGLLFKVEAFSGERNFVQITPLDKIPKNLCSLAEIKEEYGANFLMYSYNSLAYYVDCSNIKACKEKGYTVSIQLPLAIVRNWGYDCNDVVEIRGVLQEKLIVSPVKKYCAVDGKLMDPAQKPVKRIHACEDCSMDKENIKDMVLMLKDMTKMCKEIKENHAGLANRIERLEAALL